MKTILAVIIGLLFLSVFSSEYIPLAKASGTIYIRADGSIDPSTAPIHRAGTVYTLVDDIYNASIDVQKDYVILDGNNHMLQCVGESRNLFGIRLYMRKSVTITNLVISSGFVYGILLQYSSQNEISSNFIQGYTDCGISLQGSDHNNLQNNTVTTAYEAVWLDDSSYNTLNLNKVRNNTWGLELFFGTENKLRRNVMDDNEFDFMVGGVQLQYYLHDVDPSNLVDGRSIIYWVNRHNETVPLNAGGVFIVNSTGITVRNLKLENTGGVTLAHTRYSVVENVTTTRTCPGICLEYSDYNVITRNNITESEGAGIVPILSAHNNITHNIVRKTKGCGIWLEDTSHNIVYGNTVSHSTPNGPQEFDGAGILIDDSTYCEAIANNVTENAYGINVGATPSVRNRVIGNNIEENGVGLILYDARYNTLYHNNFVKNNLQEVCAYYDTQGAAFDRGYSVGGNYWSSCAGVDLYCGARQNETGSDGIFDTPYVVGEYNQDNYPLAHPYGAIRNIDTNRTYFTIQSAIDAPETIEGNTLFVERGAYYEHVVVDKSLELVGENRGTTILDGSGTLATILDIIADNVTVEGFAVQNCARTNQSDDAGISLANSNYVRIFDNIITKTRCGIKLLNSTNCIVSGNTVIGNDVGIQFLSMSGNCTAYHNTFLDNKLQIDNLDGMSNIWDNGCEGNEWSDYVGVDLNGDEIGDQPYVIDENNTDMYPLMGSWTVEGRNINIVLSTELAIVFDIVSSPGITKANRTQDDLNTPSDFRSTGYFCSIRTTAQYSNTILIELVYDDLDMTREEEKALQLMRFNNTSQEWEKLATTVNTQSNTVFGETDRLFSFGLFCPTILGDVDRDLDVDVFDIVRIAGAYGTSKPDPRYDVRCDIDRDDDVDIFDIVVAAMNYGEEYP